MIAALTRRQMQLLNFIRSHVAEHGRVPTFGEMADGIGTSKGYAHNMVSLLEKAGAVVRDSAHPRALRLSHEAWSSFHVSFDEEVAEALQDYARTTGAKPETVIKEAVRAYVGRAGARA